MQMTENRLRKLCYAAAALALLTGNAAAQSNPLMPHMSIGADKQRSPEEKERDQAIDRAYQSATKKIPDQKPAADPWASVRSTSQTSSQTTAQNKQTTAQTKKPQ